MRSTAPAAVAASISYSRARLVALRRQVRAVPAVHMTIGRISATQSSRFRSAPRCRSPQHARRREGPSRSTRPTTSATSDPIAQLGMSRRAGLHLADDRADLGAGPNRLTRSRAPGPMPMPSARMRPAALSPSWCTAAAGTPERDDDDSDGDLHGSRRRVATLAGGIDVALRGEGVVGLGADPLRAPVRPQGRAVRAGGLRRRPADGLPGHGRAVGVGHCTHCGCQELAGKLIHARKTHRRVLSKRLK